MTAHHALPLAFAANRRIIAPRSDDDPLMQYAFPLITVLIWAVNTAVTKASAGVIFPAEIGFYRWALAGLLFTPFMIKPVWANRAAIKPLLGKIFVLAVLGTAMYQSLAYFAAGLTTATNMGIIQSLVPMMALGLSIACLGNHLTSGALLGAILSFAGVVVVVSAGNPAQLIEHGVNRGDAMVLVAAASYAVYSTLLKKWQLRLPPLQLLYVQILLAILVLLPPFILSSKTGLNASNIPMVLYAAIPTSMLAPWLWMTAIMRLGPSRTTLFFNLMPIATALIAAATLGEQLALYHLFGGALTLCGVVLAERWATPLRSKAS
ncbi:Membrane protein [Pseudomonas syringae pv. maculicola]|nr:Membrane protein [Pseudomonas syringae pv. maculicola]